MYKTNSSNHYFNCFFSSNQAVIKIIITKRNRRDMRASASMVLWRVPEHFNNQINRREMREGEIKKRIGERDQK